MNKTISVGSLFAGVGGICLGFKNVENHKAKYDLIWANEIDTYACETYRTNFSHSIIEGDINLILHPEKIDDNLKDLLNELESANESKNKDKLLNQISEFKKNRDDMYISYCKKHKQILNQPIDILNGGFPCQAFSIAGEQKGFLDQRGNLFLAIVDLIEQLGAKFYKPRAILLENVKNLKSHDASNTYKVIKSNLEKSGYIIKDAILNTMDYSDLPQNRERIYIVGFLNKEDADKFTMFDNLLKYKNTKTLIDRENDIRKVIDYSVDTPKYFYTKDKYPNYFVTEDEYILLDGEKKSVRINLTEDVNEMHQFYQVRRGQYVRKNKSNVCPTLTANMGTGGHNVPLIKVENGIRKLTPTETFKLQGFPVGNGYLLPTKMNGKPYPDSQLYKQAGNAVSVPVIKLIAEELLSILSNDMR